MATPSSFLPPFIDLGSLNPHTIHKNSHMLAIIVQERKERPDLTLLVRALQADKQLDTFDWHYDNHH